MLKYDGELAIATGASFKTVIWVNQKILWSELVKKLTTETKTRFTHREYRALPKLEQLKVKDNGGFVGGTIRGGKRNPQNIENRQIIALDLDIAYSSFWDDAVSLYPNAMVLHSTHSHTPELPRYRLIIPLSRTVKPDEYEAIARFIAGSFGIHYFDDTTFQVNRLMFWPATPTDIDFYYKVQDGPWLNPDEILSQYDDWQDIFEWPRNPVTAANIKQDVDKQEDPETKPGIIGAFCRAYSISAAIDTFLPDIYTKATDGRYTYTKGSTAGGVLVYNDKFSFSHHGTDPTTSRLCNAFDLVRIHKFGHYDINTKAKKDTTKKSFKKMEELILQDVNVKKQIISDNTDLPFTDLKWIEELDIDRSGKYVSSARNINTILLKDETIKDAFAYNRFDRKIYLQRSMIWRDISKLEPIKDLDLAGIRNYLDVVYNIVSSSKIDDAVQLEAERNAFHPVIDYLTGLEWDGKNRVDSLFQDYFGAPNNIYIIEAARIFLTAAVARVFEPGIKYDLVVTIIGHQGTGKSTFFKKLGKNWFSDTFTTFQGKEAFEQIQGVWVLELAELSGLKRSDIEAVKQFISKSEDMFRPAYGRVVETYPRQCVIVGTTNEDDFLQDPSGNRRFIPIDTNMAEAKLSVFKDLTEYEVDQIWAESYNLYSEGQALIMTPRADALAKIEQSKHTEQDERMGLILEYLDMLLPDNWDSMDIYDRRDYINTSTMRTKGTKVREYVCIAEIWCECFSRNKDDMNRYNTKDINNILKRLPDWVRVKTTKRFTNYGVQKYYKRKEK